MDKEKDKNKKVNTTSKESTKKVAKDTSKDSIKDSKVETKSFNKVDSKAKKEDLFSNIDEKGKDKKEKSTSKDTAKSTSKDAVKGTVTVNKKIEEKTKETKVKSSSKGGKYVAISIVLICIIAIIVGIVYFIKTPYYTLIKAFDAMKSEDISTINKYVSYDDLMNSVIGNLNVGEEMTEFEKNCFSDFSFKINTVKVEGDIAIVNIDTTNKNFRNAITKWSQSIYQKFINGEEISNEEGIKLLNNCLKDESIGTITTNEDITLTRVDGKWIIKVDEGLKDAIFPGISEVVNSIDTLTE